MPKVDVDRAQATNPRLLRADAVSTGAAGAAVGAVLGLVIAPGPGVMIGSVVGAALGGSIGAANTHWGR